jgi:type VI secretion system secreted protein VgrG
MDYDKKVFSVDTKYGHKFTLDDEAKKIALQTKENHILALDDDKKLITLQDGKGKHVFQIDVGGGKIILSTQGDISIKAKGKFDLEAAEMSLTAKSGGVNIKASAGDIMVDGMNVNVAGKQKVALEGKVEASLSSAQTKIEGKATLEMTSKGQTKVGGLQVSVEGQAMSEIKGAIVMIN